VTVILIAGSRGYPAKYGGFETLAHKLAENWSDENIETIVTGFSECSYKPLSVTSYKQGRIMSVTISLPIWSRLKNLVSTFITVLHCANNYNFDYALVLNDVNLPSALFLKARGIKTVVHLDGDETSRRGLPKFGQLLHKFFRTLILAFFDSVILDSHALLKFVPNSKKDSIHIIKYGVDPEEIYVSEVPTVLDFPSKNYILSIARFVPENNIVEIINAYLKSNCQIPLVIVGKGTGRYQYEEEINRLCQTSTKEIFILNAIYDTKYIHYLIKNSGLYVHGHEAGGTNPILISARYFAKRLIVHDNVYNREAARADEEFWKNINDLSAIFNEIKQVNEKSNQTFINGGFFVSWKTIATQYLDLMK
jgi:glycosyltransferase involved in cell wall biosynthesis